MIRPLIFYWANTDPFFLCILSTPLSQLLIEVCSLIPEKYHCLSPLRTPLPAPPSSAVPRQARRWDGRRCYLVLVCKGKLFIWLCEGTRLINFSFLPHADFAISPKDINPGGIMEGKHHKKTQDTTRMGKNWGVCV